VRLAFTEHDIAHWARFSGDFNPIHFDLEAARAAGAGTLIVHGMLAVLAAKQRCEAVFTTPQGVASGWRRFRARFKKPVEARVAVALEQADQTEGRRFALVDAQDGARHVEGSFAACAAPAVAEAGAVTETLSLPAAMLTERLASFARAYPHAHSPWLALDAIVFSEFLLRGLGAVTRLAGLPGPDTGSFAGIRDGLVVQTSHTVSFDAAVLGSGAPGLPPEASLTCAIVADPPTDMGNALAGTVKVVCHAGAAHVMSLDLGLLVLRADRLRSVS
jgi:acyl dehydratase